MTRAIRGGPAQTARAISSSDLIDNGGDYRLASRVAVPIYGLTELGDRKPRPGRPAVFYPVTAAEIDGGRFELMGGPAEPVYEVGEDEGEGLVAYPVYVVGGEFGTPPAPPPGPDYDDDAVIYWGASADLLTAERKQLDSDLFVALKAAGIFQLLDAAWMFAHENETVAFRNMIKRAHDCTRGGSGSNATNPLFTADRGIKGTNGILAYMDTNYNPATQAVNYTLDNCGYGVYSRTDLAESRFDMGHAGAGTTPRAYLSLRTGSGSCIYHANNPAPGGAVGNANSLGLHHVLRTASNALAVFKNGASLGTDATVSSTITSSNFFICVFNVPGVTGVSVTNREYAFAFVGASLSGLEAALFNLIEPYLDAIGAGVV